MGGGGWACVGKGGKAARPTVLKVSSMTIIQRGKTSLFIRISPLQHLLADRPYHTRTQPEHKDARLTTDKFPDPLMS
jgi:hypothetical protein